MVIMLVACSSERSLPDPEPTGGGVHPSGMLDPNSDNFHAKELARQGFDLALCAKCHGEDFAGGIAKVTCRQCHVAGPDACETCHRNGGPTSGAHVAHRAAGQACSECHVVPARWDAEGHVRRAGKADPGPAEVVFGSLASATLDPADRDGPATYDGTTCSNVYCHGAALHAGGGSATAPRWDDPTTPGGCTTCHAAPPPSHLQSITVETCASCHGGAPHIDGVVQVGTTCNGCHGSAESPAPPRDLSGNTFTTAIGVGAHQAHLSGQARLRGPIPCEECHLVPTAVGDVGHIDSELPAEVFPVGSGTLARAGGAAPAWDRIAGTCSNVYCHGGGTVLAGDVSSGLVRAPDWTASTGQLFCGSCHGLPPTGHAPGITINDCATCHPSVDSFGNPILTGSPVTSRHLDGVIDVF
jgi:predicted CxxxxCH...CXXCH cytochrome family protein